MSLALLLEAVAYPLNPLCGITVVGVLTLEDSFLTLQDTVFCWWFAREVPVGEKLPSRTLAGASEQLLESLSTARSQSDVGCIRPIFDLGQGVVALPIEQ